MLPPPLRVTIKNRFALGRATVTQNDRSVGRSPFPASQATGPALGPGPSGFKSRTKALRRSGFLLLMALVGCTPPGPRALLDGKRKIEHHRYLEAVEQLETATALLPTNANAWNYLGLAYHYAGKPVEAE